MKKFEETGVVTNIERHVHNRFVGSAENITIVSESVFEEPNVSIPPHPQQLGLPYDTLCCILHLGLLGICA